MPGTDKIPAHADGSEGNTHQLTLLPARPDLLGLKTQLVVMGSSTIIGCTFAYLASLKVGFLLDDFLHIDYVARACSLDYTDFLTNFWGNWAGSDIMKSYRPLASLSLFIDYLVWGKDAYGYHLTNILLMVGSAVLCGLLAFELSARSGNRLVASTSMWAATLFFLYPLHPEAGAWVIGRVDLLCTFFYLLCLFSYMRFRATRDRPLLFVSLASMLCALLSKEMAVTIPAVISLAELLFYSSEDSSSSLRLISADDRKIRAARRASSRAAYVLLFWFLLGFVATVRFMLLGTLVGGYGNSEFPLAAFGNFFDKATLLKVIIPFSEEVSFSPWLKPTLMAGYALTLISFLIRLSFCRYSLDWRVLFFLISFAVLAVLPTFQVWHIYPNLVGSRLVYLSSAPLIILVCFLALPACDRLNRKIGQLSTYIGTVGLFLIGLVWSMVLASNLKVWEIAGQRMEALRTQAEAIVTHAEGSGSKPAFMDLPTDYAGAGMLTRPLYLSFCLQRPFTTRPKAPEFFSNEPLITGSHDFMWPQRLENYLSEFGSENAYRYDSKDGVFRKWKPSSGKGSLLPNSTIGSNLIIESLNGDTSLPVAKLGQWILSDENEAYVESVGNGLLINPGKVGLIVWTSVPEDFSPLVAQIADLDLYLPQAEIGPSAGKIFLVWSSGNSPQYEAEVFPRTSGKILVWLGRYRNWLLGPAPKRVGIKFLPGSYRACLKGISIRAATSFVPKLSLVGEKLLFDGSKVEGASKLKLYVSRPNTTFDVQSQSELTSLAGQNSQADCLGTFSQLKGQCTLKSQVLLEGSPTPNVGHSSLQRQARIQCVDANDAAIGLPSEPVELPANRF